MAQKKIQSLKLGQLLIEKGIISAEQLEASLAEQKKTKQLLGEILLRTGALNDEALYKILSEQAGVDFIQLKGFSISPELIAEIPFKLALHYQMIPIRSDEHSITVATCNPINLHTLDDLRLLLHKAIELVFASRKEISDALKKYYGLGANTMDKMMPGLERLSSVAAKETQNIEGSNEDASIVKFVNEILLEACRERASDIHIEPYEDTAAVRYRVDGILHETKVAAAIHSYHSAIISRVKIMANLNIGETRLPQDGRIRIQLDGKEMDLRVSVLPTPYGESVVIRLLSSNVFFGMDGLGLLPPDLKLLEGILQSPYGILFVTGPTGSGKTTTLYSCLSKINDPDRKIITIEDPIEYRLKGVTQVQVHPRISLTFSSALRSMLRHDPDVIMVGEVRDSETAEITIRVALTGHLVFSTLHTNDAASAVTRLIDMGVEPFLVASSVQGFIAQRLVRKICSACKRPAVLGEEILRHFDIKSGREKSAHLPAGTQDFFEGAGCEACKFTGYQGRTAIYEILVLNAAIKEMILRKVSAEEIKRKAVELGMRTLRQDGFEKMLLGWTTASEILRVTQNNDV